MKPLSDGELQTNHVSLPYNHTDFTHDLNIRSFVRLQICELAHIACILPKAARALFNLQLTSYSEAPSAEAFNELNRACVHNDMVCVVLDSHGLGLRDDDLEAGRACQHDAFAL